MTNPPSSASSSFTHQLIRETFKLGGAIGQVAAETGICVSDPTTCLSNVFSYATYEMPKTALESTASLAFWGSKKIFNLATTIAKANFTLESSNVNDFKSTYEAMNEEIKPSTLTKIYEVVSQQAEKLSMHSTSWITGKTIEKLKAEYTEQTLKEALGETSIPFKSIDLIGPSLLLSFCAHKTLNNLSEAAHHFKLLVTGKRLVSTLYKTTAANCTMAGGCEIGVSKTKFCTTTSLLKDTVMETAFAGLWGTGAYFTYHSIFNAIEAASNSSEQAAVVTKAILITGLVTPTLLRFIKEAITPPIITQSTSPSTAPNFIYTDSQSMNYSSDLIKPQVVGIFPESSNSRLSTSSEELNFQEAVKVLQKYRKPESSGSAN